MAEICIHTPQGMVCYRNQAQATAQGVDVEWDIFFKKDPHDGNPEQWNHNGKLHDHLGEDTHHARLDVLFARAKKDFKKELAAHGIDLDDWHVITRR